MLFLWSWVFLLLISKSFLRKRIIILFLVIFLFNFLENNGLCFIIFTVLIILQEMSEYFTSAKTKIIVSLFFFSSISIIISQSILVMWLNIEIQTFSIIIFNLLNKKLNINIVESMVKYLIVSTIASLLILFYQTTNLMHININVINSFWQTEYNELFVFIFIMGIIIKLGVSPIHLWLPEVYSSLSWKGIFLVSIIPKITFLFILYNTIIWESLYIILGVMSIITGTIGALNQNCIKKFIAYSSIGNLGFIFLCMTQMEERYFVSFIFYCLFYFITTLCFIINMLKKNKKLIINLTGSTETKNINSFILLVIFLSYMGLPPLLGFISKLLAFLNIISSIGIMVSLSVITVTVLSAFVYLRIINLSLCTKQKNFYCWNKNFNKSSYSWLCELTITLLSIFLWVNIKPLIFLIEYNNFCI